MLPNGPAMRICYSDPPYLGCGKKYVADWGPTALEWDKLETHENLIVTMRDEFPDGWAVSLHEPSLETYLHICRRVVGENKVRTSPWVKPFASFKPGVNPAHVWEPIIWYGGRKLGRDVPTVRDYVSCNITLKKGLTGAKPEPFSFWLFNVLGMRHTDTFVDRFPGTGGVSAAWNAFRLQSSAA